MAVDMRALQTHVTFVVGTVLVCPRRFVQSREEIADLRYDEAARAVRLYGHAVAVEAVLNDGGGGGRVPPAVRARRRLRPDGGRLLACASRATPTTCAPSTTTPTTRGGREEALGTARLAPSTTR